MADLLPVESALAAAWPPEAWQDVTVLLAVSGGADSVALLRAMTRLKRTGEGRLCTAHLNHQLRGKESARDESFVVDLCRNLGVRCEVGHAEIDRLAAERGDGLESAARSARYEFLQLTAARLGARYVVTAHTADDQAETILHRIIRGTGVGGLAGMSRARPLGPATLLRPMLGIRRLELLTYLDSLDQAYRSDSSNADVRFTRNRIRHKLLPDLAEHFNAGVIDALLRLGSLAGEVQGVIRLLVEDLAERCLAVESPTAIKIDAAALAAQPRYVVRELLIEAWRLQSWPLQAMGFAQWEKLAEMVSLAADFDDSSAFKQTFPGNVQASAGGGYLRLVRSATETLE